MFACLIFLLFSEGRERVTLLHYVTLCVVMGYQDSRETVK